MAGISQTWNQIPEASGSPIGVQGMKDVGQSLLIFLDINMELYGKWVSHNVSQRPLQDAGAEGRGLANWAMTLAPWVHF